MAIFLWCFAADDARAADKPVDINKASVAELKTLPGIGDAEAKRIVAARPYPSKAKLVADNVLSFDTFVALKDRIVAIQPLPPRRTDASTTVNQNQSKPGGKP